MNLFTNIVSNLWYALAALLVISLILHFFLVWPKNLTKKGWKIVDYFWITLTAIGLIGTTNNVKLALSKGQLSMIYPRLSFQIKYLNSFLSPQGSSIVCRTSIRNEYSPSNFDNIVADDNKSCEWSKRIYQIVAKVDTINYTTINSALLPSLETVENKWFKGVILDNINQYNNLVVEKDGYQKDLNDLADNEFLFFSPLLLIIGLAIRLTKVTGELMHEI